MITFSKFGKKGRLGNQLFQYAAMLGMANKYNQKLAFPGWVYAKYFNNYPSIALNPGKPIKEPAFHYTKEFYDIIDWNQNVDLDGYFQTEKYWEHCKDLVKEQLKFKPDFMNEVAKQLPISDSKQRIAISIRRGDYVDNANYELLPISYYFLALQEHFPDWQNDHLFIFSDDPAYCKIHFGCLPNTYIIPNTFDNMDKSKYFDENRSAVAQLAMMSMCDHFIIANSTFSWWGAYMGEKEYSKIVRPAAYFGKLKEACDIRDHYPAHWISYDHKEEHGSNKKIDLSDVTFTVPVSYDHKDRKQNLDLNICMLQRDIKTNIIIGEHGSDFFKYFSQWCQYIKFEYPEFHRTRMLNKMARIATTPILANWDADVFISPIQIWYSVQCIRDGADMVFPYDGRFARVERSGWFKQLEKRLDVGIFIKVVFKGTRPEDKLSVGGAIFFNRQKFLTGGGENENFVAYGPEDVERDVRFRKIGYNVQRTTGILYHMDHFKGPNSKCAGNKYDKQNHDELEKIYEMRREELLKYIDTWKQITE